MESVVQVLRYERHRPKSDRSFIWGPSFGQEVGLNLKTGPNIGTLGPVWHHYENVSF